MNNIIKDSPCKDKEKLYKTFINLLDNKAPIVFKPLRSTNFNKKAYQYNKYQDVSGYRNEELFDRLKNARLFTYKQLKKCSPLSENKKLCVLWFLIPNELVNEVQNIEPVTNKINTNGASVELYCLGGKIFVFSCHVDDNNM